MVTLLFACVFSLTEAECAHPKKGEESYNCATAAANRGDFARAAALIASHIPDSKPDGEFWAHNELTWIRWAMGDFAGALVETDQQRLTASRVKKAKDRTALMLHALWDRAYLLRELASQQPKESREPTLAYAKAAKSEYEKLGPKDGGVPIIEAWFALLDGDGAAAKKAIEKVDFAKRDDVQDLYVIWRALKAGGNDADAQKVLDQVKSSTNQYLGLALYGRLFKE